MPTNFLTKYDKRATGHEIAKSESRVIPSLPPYTVTLEEVPLESSDVSILGFTESNSGLTGGEFIVDFATGILYFSAYDAGKSINPQYMGTGTIIFAEDINLIQTSVNALEVETASAQGSMSTIDARLSVSLNANGTLKNNSVTPSAISNLNSGDVFNFPNVSIAGDLHVFGTEFVVHSEDISLQSNTLTLNAGATLAGDASILVWRGATATPESSLTWRELDKAWQINGITGTAIETSEILTTVNSDKIVMTKLTQVGLYASDPTVTVADIGCIFYNTTDRQFKGVASDGVGGYVINLLG